ncbi:MAG TPA: phytanoyl-CoA dioxygenase family protein [Candidatus Dormibacteraeota bacterium]|jgi:hypothetical protein|nr:phytanoyl-CoA dioxygenase family protein [Candidatus Dormibacteraeota bacterium]
MLTEISELLPSDADVAFFAEHGYWISPPIVPDEVLDTARRGADRLYRGDVDHALPSGERMFGWTAEQGDVLRKNDFSSLLVDELAQLVRLPVIAATAARLGGHEEIRLWHDQLLYKPVEREQAVRVGWHTDRQYWQTCSSEDMLTAWVPFHDIEPEHGPVSFVDGSHHWGEDVVLDFFNPDMTTVESLLERHRAELAVATMPRGAVSFHHCRTIHGSAANHSGEPRRAIAIHLQPQGNHYVARPKPDGTLFAHGNDRLVRRTSGGDPDYTDPAACPRLWPGQEGRAG